MEPTAKRLAVVAHFLSANFGDRYQATGMLQHLADYSIETSGVEVICINIFEGTEVDPDVWIGLEQANNRDVHNIRAVDIASFDVIVMLTGSISHKAQFVKVGIEALRSRRLKRLIIWGGFTECADGTRTHRADVEALRPLLTEHRTLFLARSWDDFAICAMIATQDQATIGGDPILLYNTPDSTSAPQRRQRANVPIIWSGTIVHGELIPLFKEITGIGSVNISIDPDQDFALCSALGIDNLQYITDIEQFCDNSIAWRGVITQRLHGGVMAKKFNGKCPVLFMPRDLSGRLAGASKYHASALAAYAPECPIGQVVSVHQRETLIDFINRPESYYNEAHELNFARYCLVTERACRQVTKIIMNS